MLLPSMIGPHWADNTATASLRPSSITPAKTSMMAGISGANPAAFDALASK